MAYGTASDLRDVLVPRGDPLSNTAASMDDIQLEEAIVDAMGLVDGYTGTAFDDQDVPRLVKTLTLHIAAYFATMTYRKNVELSQRIRSCSGTRTPFRSSPRSSRASSPLSPTLRINPG